MPPNCLFPHCGCRLYVASAPAAIEIPHIKKRIMFKSLSGEKPTIDDLKIWERAIMTCLKLPLLGDDSKERRFVCASHFEARFMVNGQLVYHPENLPIPIKSVSHTIQPDTSRSYQREEEKVAKIIKNSSQDDAKVIDEKINELEECKRHLQRAMAEAATFKVKWQKAEATSDRLSSENDKLTAGYLRYEKIKHYTNLEVYTLTGCQSLEVFDALFGLVVATIGTDQLYQYRTGRNARHTGGKLGRSASGPTAMSSLDKFFLTLFILRTGNNLNVAKSLFGIKSTTTVTSYFVTWLHALSITLMKQCPFPNQEDTQAATPESWLRTFGNRRCRIIIDSTNIPIPTAHDPDVQGSTYSKYYAGNVAKILLGITTSGVITFVSLPYPGRISDVDLAKILLDLELIDPGDDICADRGFTIHHLTYALGIGMLMPPKMQRGVQFFSQEQAEETSKIANKRIHIERAMKRIKAFKYLTKVIPFDQFDILSHIVFVIAFLSNLQPPIIDSDTVNQDSDSDQLSDPEVSGDLDEVEAKSDQ